MGPQRPTLMDKWVLWGHHRNIQESDIVAVRVSIFFQDLNNVSAFRPWFSVYSQQPNPTKSV
jgi:hypothetical protein